MFLGSNSMKKTGIDIKRVFTYFLFLFIYFPMKPRPAESRILVGFSCIFSMFSQVASRIVFVSILLGFGANFDSFFHCFGKTIDDKSRLLLSLILNTFFDRFRLHFGGSWGRLGGHLGSLGGSFGSTFGVCLARVAPRGARDPIWKDLGSILEGF